MLNDGSGAAEAARSDTSRPSSTCRLCGRDRRLVKAHAIPEAFFRVFRAGGENPLLVSNIPDAFPRRAPIGVYDDGILCEECERTFGEVDDYGIRVLLTEFDELFQPVVDDSGRTVGFQSRDIDQELLLRFLVATLWRASVSTRGFYSGVRLGAYESQVAGITEVARPVPSVFAAALSVWTPVDTSRRLVHPVLDPRRERWNGVNAYRVYFGRVVAYVKVDSRPFPSPHREVALCQQDHLYVINRDFPTSKDFSAMAKTAKTSFRRQQIARARRMPKGRY